MTTPAKPRPVKDFSPDEARKLRAQAFSHAEGIIESISLVAKGEKTAKNGQVNAARVILERVLPAISVSETTTASLNISGELGEIPRETLEKLVKSTLTKGELSAEKDREILDITPDKTQKSAKSHPVKD